LEEFVMNRIWLSSLAVAFSCAVAVSPTRADDPLALQWQMATDREHEECYDRHRMCAQDCLTTGYYDQCRSHCDLLLTDCQRRVESAAAYGRTSTQMFNDSLRNLFGVPPQ
jgi:hypothetical protein